MPGVNGRSSFVRERGRRVWLGGLEASGRPGGPATITPCGRGHRSRAAKLPESKNGARLPLAVASIPSAPPSGRGRWWRERRGESELCGVLLGPEVRGSVTHFTPIYGDFAAVFAGLVRFEQFFS